MIASEMYDEFGGEEGVLSGSNLIILEIEYGAFFKEFEVVII